MSKIEILSRTDFPNRIRYTAGATDDAGNVLSKGNFSLLKTKFGKEFVTTMTAGGVATPIENRRGGNVRKIFEHMYRFMIDEGAAVSVIHPFSFTFYNKFGYEKVADHLILRFPTRLIDFVPRACNFVPYNESMLADMHRIYFEFSKGRNLLTLRADDTYFKDKNAYICYKNGEPIAYIVYKTDKTLVINNYRDTFVTVTEMAYTCPDGLYELFSFMRMFEGEFDEIVLPDCALYSEVELMLRHYTHTEYKRLPDLAAKILNTELMLKAVDYPCREGEFTVKIIDDLPTVSGVYNVCYGGGDSKVTRLSDSSDADITMPAPIFTRLIYGYDPIDAQSIGYIKDVEVNGRTEDLFRAFPKKPCGIFEHF